MFNNKVTGIMIKPSMLDAWFNDRKHSL